MGISASLSPTGDPLSSFLVQVSHHLPVGTPLERMSFLAGALSGLGKGPMGAAKSGAVQATIAAAARIVADAEEGSPLAPLADLVRGFSDRIPVGDEYTRTGIALSSVLGAAGGIRNRHRGLISSALLGAGRGMAIHGLGLLMSELALREEALDHGVSIDLGFGGIRFGQPVAAALYTPQGESLPVDGSTQREDADCRRRMDAWAVARIDRASAAADTALARLADQTGEAFGRPHQIYLVSKGSPDHLPNGVYGHYEAREPDGSGVGTSQIRFSAETVPLRHVRDLTRDAAHEKVHGHSRADFDLRARKILGLAGDKNATKAREAFTEFVATRATAAPLSLTSNRYMLDVFRLNRFTNRLSPNEQIRLLAAIQRCFNENSLDPMVTYLGNLGARGDEQAILKAILKVDFGSLFPAGTKFP